MNLIGVRFGVDVNSFSVVLVYYNDLALLSL
jgi:hypothetical protein